MFKIKLGGDLVLDEAEIYNTWLKRGCFKFDTTREDNFVFVLPPPNANGELHLGHSFGYTIMDCVGRFQRMMGKNVLLIPGKDHAGIQTQVIFEKILREKGVDLSNLSREQLFNMCYEFCLDRARYMRAQEQSLGLGCDWDYELFTLDPKVSEIVLDTFVRLYKDGQAYRANRIVNWSVVSQTSISDIEVEYVEKKGLLYYVVYPWADNQPECEEFQVTDTIHEWEKFNDAYLVHSESLLPEFALIDGHKCIKFKRVDVKSRHSTLYLKMFSCKNGMIVATTRPETMLGDVALVVHPDDPRYKNFVNKVVRIPVLDREIKILAHSMADPTYGTGALKVTPAHDFKDFRIGKDLSLEPIQVIGKDGRITPAGDKYVGLTVQEARDAIVNDLEQNGFLKDKIEILHNVPISERAKDVIEPLITEQWWINFDNIRQEAIKRIRDTNELEVYPPEFKDLIIQWFEKLEDWNVSRQLWWGHRIPAWFRGDDLVGVSIEPLPDTEQDPDTFDTWFSSGQWAYSTLAAKNLLDLEQIERYSSNYPTHLMVMGRDILFFWACRMILLGLYRTNRIPFRKLYFHGLILDENGQKMSKSRGNGIEPKQIQERFGTDVLRLALLNGFTPGRDIRFGTSKCEAWAKFENKLVNSMKFVSMNSHDLAFQIDHPILIAYVDKAKQKLDEFRRGLELFEFSSTLDNIYAFFWDDFCDWLIEISKILFKTELKNQTYSCLLGCAEAILAMLHPFAPFVTEFLYQKLFQSDSILAGSRLDSLLINKINTSTVSYDLEELYEVVRTLRRFKVITKDDVACAFEPVALHERELVLSLSGCEGCSENEGFKIKVRNRILSVSVKNPQGLKTELVKMVDQTSKQIQRLQSLLRSDFHSKAPEEIVRKEKEKLARIQAELMFLEETLRAMASS